MSLGSHDAQSNTLRVFTLLSTLRPVWSGCLILSCGLSGSAADLALAANIAGSTCLSIDPSAENCHAALRNGFVDFVVNNLDEAIRALKNEIRKGRPLSVALEGEAVGVLSAIIARGILPDIFTAFSPEGAGSTAAELDAFARAARAFHQLGTNIVDFDGALAAPFSAGGSEFPKVSTESHPGARPDQPPSTSARTLINAAGELDSFTSEHRLSLDIFEFDSATSLRSFDTEVLTVIPLGDPRRRWVSAASRHFQRSRSADTPSHRRALLLTPPEHDRLALRHSPRN